MDEPPRLLTPAFQGGIHGAVGDGDEEEDGQRVKQIQSGDGNLGLAQGKVHLAGLVLHSRRHLRVASLWGLVVGKEKDEKGVCDECTIDRASSFAVTRPNPYTHTYTHVPSRA